MAGNGGFIKFSIQLYSVIPKYFFNTMVYNLQYAKYNLLNFIMNFAIVYQFKN
ncbi:hypothetical protein J2Y02_001479 [Neobacillus drentensis]|nr:hypothetical protein [Neobacillus drentensis]